MRTGSLRTRRLASCGFVLALGFCSWAVRSFAQNPAESIYSYSARTSDVFRTGTWQMINLEALTGCTSFDLEIVETAGEPPNVWEMWANPAASGRYVEPDQKFVLKFNHEVDAALVANAVEIWGKVSRSEDRWVDCSSPEAANLPKYTHYISFREGDIRHYLGMKNLIHIGHEEPFYRGCQYFLSIQTDPFTADGKCLIGRARPFTISPDARTPFERETLHARYDVNTGEVRSFDMKPGVNLTVGEMWLRYKRELGLRVRDKMVPLRGYPQAIGEGAGRQLTRFRQEYRGVPVIGGSLVVVEQDGYVTGAVGRIVRDLDLDTEPVIDAAAALEHAKSAAPAERYLWEAKPETFSAPAGDLVIVPEGDSWRLAWRFALATARPLNEFLIDIDARDSEGRVIRKVSTVRSAFEDVGKLLWSQAEVVDKQPCTLVTRYDGTIELDAENPFQCSLAVKPPDVQLVLLDSAFFDRIITGKMNDFGDEELIYDRNGDLIFDGCGTATCDPNAPPYPEEIDGASVHWALARALELVRLLDIGSSQVLYRAGEAEPPEDAEPTRVIQYVTSNMSLFDVSLAAYFPIQKFILYGTKAPGLPPIVFPNVVGHELCHAYVRTLISDFEYRGEGGLIEEGLCDVLGTLVEHHLRGPENSDWCIGTELRPGESCPKRRLDDPLAGEPASPTTYLGITDQQTVASCASDPRGGEYQIYCEFHGRSTIVSHAFYLMIVGKSGFNELGCSYSVPPLSEDPVRSREAAGRILWTTLSKHLTASMDLAVLREATLRAARELFPSTVEEGIETPSSQVMTVQAAWNAVGVYGPDEEAYYEPHSGEQSVPPWPASLSFQLPEGVEDREWQIQLSKYRDFVGDAQVKDAVLRGEHGLTLAADGQYRILFGADFELDPKTRYYWRYREKSEETWDLCLPVQGFGTRSVAPHKIRPVAPPPAAPEVVFANVALEWERVEGATEYFLKISTDPASGCGQPPAGDATAQAMTALVPQTPSGSVSRVVSLSRNQQYYWWVRALGPGGRAGDCDDGNYATFKTVDFPKPQPLYPDADDHPSFANPYNLFRWTPVEGAATYYLTFYRRTADGLPGEVLPQSGSQHTFQIIMGGVETEVTGLANDPNGFCWSVRAVGPNGEQGPPSDSVCVTLSPGPVELIQPLSADGRIPYDSGVLFKWTCQYAPHGFRMALHDFSANELIIQAEPGDVTDLPGSDIYQFYFGGRLKPETSYSWRVIALKADGTESSWDSEVIYTARAVTEEEAQPPPPDCETLPPPVPDLPDAYKTVGPNPYLSFSVVSGATHYLIDVLVKNVSTQGVSRVGGNIYEASALRRTTTGFEVLAPVSLSSSFINNTTYTWCVRARKGTGCQYELFNALAQDAGCAGPFFVNE